MPCRATQDRWITVKSSEKMWSTKWRRKWQTTLVFFAWNPKNSEEAKKMWHQKMSPPDQKVSNMLLEKSGGQLLIAPERMKWLGQSGNNSVVDMSSAEREVWRYNEQYWIGTWNVRSGNRGKLDVVTQEMARLNLNILGINELKWMGMGEFNSDDPYIYYCGQESLRRNGVNRREWCQFVSKPINITII